MDVLKWKVTRDGLVIAQVSTFLSGIDGNKIISKALDGTIHVQTVGTGTKVADVEVHCTAKERSLVNLASAEGALIATVYRDKRYYGYIEDDPEWETIEPGEMYKGSYRMLIEEVDQLDEGLK